jgi:hypothetical protein
MKTKKPKSFVKGAMDSLTKPSKPTRDDLSAQQLSTNPKERARQLDYQAQQSEQFQEGGDLNG